MKNSLFEERFLFTSITSLLVLVALIAISTITSFFFMRFDLTKDRSYSLSESTKSTIRSLDDQLVIKAYVTESLKDPQFDNASRYVHDTLREVVANNPGKVNLEFIDTSTKEDVQNIATKAGIQPFLVDTYENDAFTRKQVFLGLTFSFAGKTEVLPQITASEGFEYDVVSKIMKLSKTGQTLGIIQGFGSPDITNLDPQGESISIIGKVLEDIYTLKPINLEKESTIDPSITAILIPGFTKDVPKEKLDILTKYLEKGNAIILQSEFTVQTNEGLKITHTELPNVYAFYEKLGIKFDKNLVADKNSQKITLSSSQGNVIMQSLIDFPLIPLIKITKDHPITHGITELALPFNSRLTLTDKKFTPLLSSSANSSTVSNFDSIDIQKPEALLAKNDPYLTMAATNENHVSDTCCKIVVFGTNQIIKDSGLEPANVLSAIASHQVTSEQLKSSLKTNNGVSLIFNAAEWLGKSGDLIAIRSKGFSIAKLRDTNDTEKWIAKVLLYLLPSLLIVGYGLIRLKLRSSRSKFSYSKKS